VLGAHVSEPQELPEHGVTTVFVELGNTKLELLHPLGENSPIKKFLEKNTAGGIHHYCLEVDDIQIAISQARKHDLRLLGDGSPKIGAHGKPVIFIHPKDALGCLLEFEEV
jgi:methylmalonyl-CoA/ethylmalonyl-CoA epimerase